MTSWRSGSTLMGELLNSIPDSFYSYEPLALFEINRIYNDSNLVSTAVNVIKSILRKMCVGKKLLKGLNTR